MINNVNEKLFVTFQPLDICRNVNICITSENRFLDDYKEQFGFTPIFCNKLQDNPTSYIIADVLMGFPRNPEVAIIFKKDMNKVKEIPRLEVFRYDYTLDNSGKSVSEKLTWGNNANIFKSSNDDGVIKDYLVSEILPNEILGIYIVNADKNSVQYDNLYRYEHVEFIQWVIDCLTNTLHGFDSMTDLNKIPLADTKNVEFMNVLQTIYNQLLYKPNEINDADFMRFENIIELWLYDSIDIKSSTYRDILQSKYDNIELVTKRYSKDDEDLREKYKDNKHGLVDECNFYGNDIEPFGNIFTLTPAVGYKY